MRWTRFLVFALSLGFTAPAMAQSESAATTTHPDGWWGSVGAGVSGLRFACKDCAEQMPVHEAPSATLAFGRAIGTKVAFGVELGAAYPTFQDGSRGVASSLSGMARWYPSQSGFFLKFAVGLSRAKVFVTSDGQTLSAIRNGAGIAFGAGYDVRLGKSIALTPAAAWHMNAVGDIAVGGVQWQNVSWNTWTLGVGITFF